MKAHHLPVESSQGYSGGKAYNCSIVEAFGKLKLFYRFEQHHDFQTEIGTCDIGSGLSIIPGTVKPLKMIRHSGRIITLDDPRAIMHQGRLFLVHAQGSLGGEYKWASCVAIAEVDQSNACIGHWLPRYGKNINMSTNPSSREVVCEKNWSPFSNGEKLCFVYTINPLIVISYDLKEKSVEEISKDQPITIQDWCWGDLLGGTPLLPWKTGFAGFFHSKTNDSPGSPNSWRYHTGFYAISGKAPHRITHISRLPLFSAETDDAFDLRPKDSPWRPNVVYPCGWIEKNGNVIISAGFQDSRCVAYEFSWDEILKDVVEVT